MIVPRASTGYQKAHDKVIHDGDADDIELLPRQR